MQQSDSEEFPKNLSHQQKLEIVHALLQRNNLSSAAIKAFHQAYPNAPEEMIQTAVFHTYVDGIGAALDWLVDLELFLREPNHKLDIGNTYHLLYHLYNWHQFSVLIPDSKAKVLEHLEALKELVSDGDTDAILGTIEELEQIFKASRNYP